METLTRITATFKTRVKQLVAKAFNLTGVVTLYRIKKLFPGFKSSVNLHWFNLVDKLEKMLSDKEQQESDPTLTTITELTEKHHLSFKRECDITSDRFLLYSGNAFFGVITFNMIWKRWSFAFTTHTSSKNCNSPEEAYNLLKRNFDDWNSKTQHGLFANW